MIGTIVVAVNVGILNGDFSFAVQFSSNVGLVVCLGIGIVGVGRVLYGANRHSDNHNTAQFPKPSISY